MSLHLHLVVALAPVALSLSSCSGNRAPARSELHPGVVFPTSLGEGHGEESVLAEPAPSGSAVVPPAVASAAKTVEPPSGPPDPEPLRLAEQWEYQLAFKGGKVGVVAVVPRRFSAPVVTVRRFGRFAIELWIGPELVERVRFDFPGLAIEQPEKVGARRPLYAPIDFGRGAAVRERVLVPAAPRARRATLLDRATGESWPLPWPPDAPTPSPVPSVAPAMD